MDITALSTDFQTTKLMNDVNIKLMGMAKEQMETNSDAMQKVLEASVTPYLGQNFDMSL